MRILKIIGGALAVLVALWAGGLLWFANTLPEQPSLIIQETDAVVALTGGSERLDAGFALLAGGLTKKLLISGVGPMTSRAELRQRGLALRDKFECCVVLGRAALDTVGNARETAAWMRAEGFRSLRVVTGGYHMPRSLIEFRHAMPEIELVAHPVFPPHVKLENWWRWPGTAALVVEEYNKFLVSLVRVRISPLVP